MSQSSGLHRRCQNLYDRREYRSGVECASTGCETPAPSLRLLMSSHTVCKLCNSLIFSSNENALGCLICGLSLKVANRKWALGSWTKAWFRPVMCGREYE